VDDLAVQDTARYGKPDNSIVGAVRYWLVVRKRQQELRRDLKEAESAQVRADDMRAQLQAELGHKAHELDVKTGMVGELISKALLAQAELRGIEKARSSRSAEHKTKVESLQAAIELLEKKISPAKIAEAELRDQKRKLETDRKGVETQLKRHQIDLRNMEELIRKRQEAYSDLGKPKEERARLLADIEMFDKRRPGLTAHVNALDTELHTFDAPIADVEYRLKEIRDQMAPELSKIMALSNEIDEITRRFAEQDGETAQQVGENQKAVLTAWASAGEQVIKDKLDEPDLEAPKKQVQAAMVAATEASQKVELISRAIDSYDREVVKKAKTVVAAAAGGVLLILILLVVLL
jgi:chromosome segregation ATPase